MVSQAKSVRSRGLRISTARKPFRTACDGLLSAAAIAAVGIGILSFRLPLFSPYLYAPQAVYAFGSVPEGEIVEHQFIVRNLHPWPVTVKDVKGSCGCTRTVLEHDPPFRLAPFQAVTIKARLDTDRNSGATSQALQVITSDNPDGSPLVLTGNVVPAPSSASVSVKER